jgi:tripartite ATP-independent transporter DctM subunit
MIHFVRDNMAPLMFGGMILFMLIGYPAAFSLAAVGLFFGFIGIELDLIRPDFLGNLTYQLFGIVSNDLLLAIPFFTFMGAILERCGLAEDLLDSIGQLFGPVRGGMSYAVIFVGAILGAITGTVAASVIAMGVIAMPAMMRNGYATRHTVGVIAASGTITQLIPPSLVLVVLADQLGRSVGDMYAGAIGPSLIQIALFCIWVLIVSIFWPQDVPALPVEARTLKGWALWKKCLRGIIPSLGLIFLVLGTIFLGLATPTEAGAMGAVGSLALAAFNRTLTWPLVYQGMSITMRITAMVVYILIGARTFSLVFQGVGGKEWIEHLLTSLPGGQVGFLVFVNAFVFVIFLRDRVHHHSAVGAGRRQARHRPHLVRGADLRQHPDQLHAPAVRLCAVLSARNCAAVGEEQRHLLGRDSLGGAAGHPGGHRDLLARLGDLLALARHRNRSVQGPDRHPAARPAAAARFRRTAEAVDWVVVLKLGCGCARGSCRRSARRPATKGTGRCGTP